MQERGLDAKDFLLEEGGGQDVRDPGLSRPTYSQLQAGSNSAPRGSSLFSFAPRDLYVSS